MAKRWTSRALRPPAGHAPRPPPWLDLRPGRRGVGHAQRFGSHRRNSGKASTPPSPARPFRPPPWARGPGAGSPGLVREEVAPRLSPAGGNARRSVVTRLFGGQGAAARALPASGSPPPYLGVASSPLSSGDSAACLVPEGREAMRKESGGARGGGGGCPGRGGSGAGPRGLPPGPSPGRPGGGRGGTAPPALRGVGVRSGPRGRGARTGGAQVPAPRRSVAWAGGPRCGHRGVPGRLPQRPRRGSAPHMPSRMHWGPDGRGRGRGRGCGLGRGRGRGLGRRGGRSCRFGRVFGSVRPGGRPRPGNPLRCVQGSGMPPCPGGPCAAGQLPQRYPGSRRRARHVRNGSAGRVQRRPLGSCGVPLRSGSAERHNRRDTWPGRGLPGTLLFPYPPPPPILAPPNVRTPSPGLTHCGRVIGIKGPLPWPVVHDPSARVIGQLRTWQGAFFFLACPAQFTVVNPLCC